MFAARARTATCGRRSGEEATARCRDHPDKARNSIGASQSLPCCAAVNADRTRLMTVRTAKSSGRALRSLRRELHRLLPIDVLTTHYADQSGRVLLNLALPRATCSAIRKAATAQGQKPGEHLSRKVVAAVERDARERARRLNLQLERLLVHHAPEDLLTSAAHVFLGSRRPTSRHPSGADIANTSP